MLNWSNTISLLSSAITGTLLSVWVLRPLLRDLTVVSRDTVKRLEKLEKEVERSRK